MSDREAIEAAIRDYIEGWYTGDVERMDRCLHDDLKKRTFAADGDEGQLREVTKARMVELTSGGGGNNPSAESEIEVHEVWGDIASGHVLSPDYLDLVHLARTPNGWRITNVMFQPRS